MGHLFRTVRLALPLLLPFTASCPKPPQPTPPIDPTPQLLSNDPDIARKQIRTYLALGPMSMVPDRTTENALTAALKDGAGKGTAGVTVSPDSVSCGGNGCWSEVRYANEEAVKAFDRVMLRGQTPFRSWGYGAGRTVPEKVEGGLISIWYFNTPHPLVKR
jgi:hypothetical protein